MALIDYRDDMQRCSRCSSCKFIPLAQIKSNRFSSGCPSIEWGKFHAYSASGRFNVAFSLLDGLIPYSDRLLDIVYQCPVCGSCDVSCKISTQLEPLDMALELRAKLVEDGQLLPQHMPLIDTLRKEDTLFAGKIKNNRGNWAEGLKVKDLTTEKGEVLFHAGCRYCFDEELWGVARASISLLKGAGVDVGILGKDESCCGGRAYEMGYQGEFIKFAESNIEAWKKAGVKTVVTGCSDGYYAFNYLYPAKSGKKPNVEVLHITQFMDRLIRAGRIKPVNSVPLKVTYHDPCHLGRMGEPYIPWTGKRAQIRNIINVFDPPKPKRRGTNGVYDEPRNVLKSIPDLSLVEMERIREYAWCCGSGGGVKESYPDLALWTARERIEEAKATGAEAIVTACPWCERNFRDAIAVTGDKLQVYDVVELLHKAVI